MLSAEQKKYFLKAIINKIALLTPYSQLTTAEALDQYENLRTLLELGELFFNPSTKNLDSKLIILLSRRWERIRSSSMCYTKNPKNSVNQLCLKLAQALSPPAVTGEEIDALEPKKGPYFLLMPTLSQSENVYLENIHHLGLHEFVLSDDGRRFIPIGLCLYSAYSSLYGRFKHMVAIKDSGAASEECPELTSTEVKRITQHSNQAKEFYQDVAAYNKRRLLGDDIGPQLAQLAIALREGGANSAALRTGTELNAGVQANEGILKFYTYWENLPQQQRVAILAETPDLRNIIGRLFRPEDKDYKDVIYCVETLARQLDPLIEKYINKSSIKKFKKRVLKQEKTFEEAAKACSLTMIPERNPPKHILHLIFKLDSSTQQLIFKEVGYDNALMYALDNALDALPEFELNKEQQQQVISTEIGRWFDRAPILIAAAKRGELEVVKSLLKWGAKIESRDSNGNSALHWAAKNGHVNVVRCLLDHGASLEARGDENNTALLFAIMNKHKEVVELLLEKNADICAKNTRGANSFSYTLRQSPELIDLILMKLVTLPITTQPYLFVSDGYHYLNVLFYAADKQPLLFNALIDKALETFKKTGNNARIFTDKNSKGYTPLILAAQLNADQSISKLLAQGVTIDSTDNNGSNALHWAANNDHVAALNCLLDHGAALDARGDKGYTALSFAVLNKQENAVDLLLSKNADINVRDNNGMNALEHAVAASPEFVQPILMKLATKPINEQAECLLNLPDGPYESVYAYVIEARPDLFNSFLPKITQNDTTQVTDILSSMHFNEHFQRLRTHYQRMKEKSHNDSNYNTAAFHAKALLQACANAKIAFYQSNEPIDKKLAAFKTNCHNAIEQARPVLSKHREWGKVIAAFIVALITFPISLPLFGAGFFSTKTKSEQFLDDLQATVDNTNLYPIN